MKFKRFFAVFLFLVLFSSFYLISSQEKLGKFNTSWSSVLPGQVVAEPAITSYGFCVFTDGRSLSAYSNTGTLLWEKTTCSSRNVVISALPGDFISLYDKRDNCLKIFNPSGYMLWEKKLDFELTNMPFSGRDGRFFITGENIIQCYSINGICKWSIDTVKQKQMPLQELPDGSIIVFLLEDDNKTKALRISPFGKVLEDITFSGEVISAYTISNGVFLTFIDGSSGLFSLSEGLSQNKWVLGVKPSNSTLLSYGSECLFLELYENKVIVDKINTTDGTIIKQFNINNIKGLDLKIARLTSDSLFVADSKNCYVYSLYGLLNWSALMLDNKSGTKWNYVIYTNDNHIVFCLKNWTLNAYLTNQTKVRHKAVLNKTYKEYYKIDTTAYRFSFSDNISREIVSENRINKLKNGFYGELEIEYASDIFSICTAYLEAKGKIYSSKNMSVFDKDAYGTESSFKQLALFSTADSAGYIAKLISYTDNKSYINVLFNSVAQCGYDPDGKILKEIEFAVRRINRNDSLVLKSACDAVYSICYFMGRPAFNRKGKEILKTLLYPQYNRDVIDYAQQTMLKIVKLEN